MARTENPPFGRGETFYQGGTIDTANYGGVQHEGKEYWFEDLDYSTQGAKAARTNRYVKCRIVRNVSGVALLGKYTAAFQESGLYYGARVIGYGRLGEGRMYLIDEFLPAAGVPNGDLFWIVVEGPAMGKTPATGAEFNGDIAIGTPLVGLTAAASTAMTTAGRVVAQNYTASTQTADYRVIQNGVQNLIGRALSARTTHETQADILIEVGKW